jgi:hypothetical protein
VLWRSILWEKTKRDITLAYTRVFDSEVLLRIIISGVKYGMADMQGD